MRNLRGENTFGLELLHLYNGCKTATGSVKSSARLYILPPMPSLVSGISAMGYRSGDLGTARM